MTLKELPITGLPVGGVHPLVIVCGDPARADRIAERLDDASLLSHKREYRAINGSHGGKPVTVCSHGIGSPGAAIAFEELIAAGGRAIVRLGTCGGLRPDIQAGDIVVASAAVENIGYAREVVPDGFPAVADPRLTQLLWQSSEPFSRTQNTKTHIGIILSRDAFYGGVSAPAVPDYRTLSAAGVLAVEMECAALFIVGSLRRIQTGAILVVDGNVLETTESFDTYSPGKQVVQKAIDVAADCVLDALASYS